MTPRVNRFRWLLFIIVGIQACTTYYFRHNYSEANALLHDTQNLKVKPFLKAHLKNGDVCILRDSWKVDTVSNVVTGDGTRYDFNRAKKSEGALSIPIDSVVIFETNQKLEKTEVGRIIALSIMTGLEAGILGYCVSDPKACYGSCPTFYLNESDNFHYADAEGFSNAIAPSMEYTDIDALDPVSLKSDTFSLTMKNEALETHCINEVSLLYYPKKPGQRVYHALNDQFFLCENNYTVASAIASEGDVAAQIKAYDRSERFSLANENNLSTKEEIILTYENVTDTSQLGLIVDFRQTMMTTYFIYGAIGYMGDEVGDIFARSERNAVMKKSLKGGLKKELGNIDVYVWDSHSEKWVLQNGFYETGPIAINKQFLPLNNYKDRSQLRVKLVLNQGLWRLDYVGLTNIVEQVQPQKITPFQVLNKGVEDRDALSSLDDASKYIVSMPGSVYKMKYKLPSAASDYEFFLSSKGYYLEWMRESWLDDKNLLLLNQMVYSPQLYLRSQAKNYKVYEKQIEEDFWNSRIDSKTYSYYGN